MLRELWLCEIGQLPLNAATFAGPVVIAMLAMLVVLARLLAAVL